MYGVAKGFSSDLWGDSVYGWGSHNHARGAPYAGIYDMPAKEDSLPVALQVGMMQEGSS